MSSAEIHILNDIPPKLARELVQYATERVNKTEAREDLVGMPTVELLDPKCSPKDIRYNVSWPGKTSKVSVECILRTDYGFMDMDVYKGRSRAEALVISPPGNPGGLPSRVKKSAPGQ